MATLVLALALFAGAEVPAEQSATFQKGRSLTRLLQSGDTSIIARQMTPDALNAAGGKEGLDRLASRFQAQAGSETSVDIERAYRSHDRILYYRVSKHVRLAGASTAWSWSLDGKSILGLRVEPVLAPATSDKLQYQTKTRLRLPFGAPRDNGVWWVTQGGRDVIENYHVPSRQQRFAYDLSVTRNGQRYQGDGKKNEDYFCWDEPILAPAAGRITRAIGNQPDSLTPGVFPKREELSGHLAGNHVLIDHGTGEFSLLGHFKQGTLAVSVGQDVKAGQIVGRCGNSGRSMVPHLHYHLQNSADDQAAAGLPTQFNGYFNGAKFVERGEPQRGDYIWPEPVN